MRRDPTHAARRDPERLTSSDRSLTKNDCRRTSPPARAVSTYAPGARSFGSVICASRHANGAPSGSGCVHVATRVSPTVSAGSAPGARPASRRSIGTRCSTRSSEAIRNARTPSVTRAVLPPSSVGCGTNTSRSSTNARARGRGSATSAIPPIDCPSTSTIPSRALPRSKPSSVSSTRYRPGGRSLTLKLPSASVVAMLSTGPRTVTFTPATAVESASRTTPVRLAGRTNVSLTGVVRPRSTGMARASSARRPGASTSALHAPAARPANTTWPVASVQRGSGSRPMASHHASPRSRRRLTRAPFNG